VKALVSIAAALEKFRSLPLLFFRLCLSYGFLGPFLFKWKNTAKFAQFLAEKHYPIPEASAWVAMIFEGLGIVCLFFGFATRIITVPLMFLLFVAIATVHWGHGYDPCSNGWQIPLTYIMLLFSLLVFGPGGISVDALFSRRRKF